MRVENRIALAKAIREKIAREVEQASAWIAAVDGLPAIHERLRRVVRL
jgi:hypothetical protein